MPVAAFLLSTYNTYMPDVDTCFKTRIKIGGDTNYTYKNLTVHC